MDRFGSQVAAVLATLAFAVPMGVYIVAHPATESAPSQPTLTTARCSSSDGSATFRLHPRDLDQWFKDTDVMWDWRTARNDEVCDYTHEY